MMEVRLALPYTSASLELLPLYLAEADGDFAQRGLLLEFNYAGSSRQALELLLQRQVDLALSDAAVLVFYAAQEYPVLGVLQYFQRSPWVLLSPTPPPWASVAVGEEDAILTALLFLNRRQRAPNLALLQQGGGGWIYQPPSCAQRDPLLIDKKREGAAQVQAERQCHPLVGAPWELAGQSAALRRRVFLLPPGRRKEVERGNLHPSQFPAAPGLWYQASPLDYWSSPGSLWVALGQDLPTHTPLWRSFVESLLAAMERVFLFPEQGLERGLFAFAQEFSPPELDAALPVLEQLPLLLQGEAGPEGRRLELGALYAARYQALIAQMENLGLIEAGLSTRELLAGDRFSLGAAR